jgi:uncharacterized protein (TIGR00369 family)
VSSEPKKSPSEPDERHAKHIARMARINRSFAELVPHNAALGLVLLELGASLAVYRLPYDRRLIGNPETGVLHGGAISSLMDACCGSAVFMALAQPMPIATLDLRIDYLAPATPERDVIARADCYRVTRNVAFVRAVAFHDDEAQPVAAAAGAFMLSTKLGSSAPRAPQALTP